MKKLTSVSAMAVAFCFALSSSLSAAPIVGVAQDVSEGGNDRFTFSIDANGEQYDTIEVNVAGEVNQAGGTTAFALPSEDTAFLGPGVVFIGASAVSAQDDNAGFSGVVGFQAPQLISEALAPGTPFFQAVLPTGGSADFEVNFLRSGSFIPDFSQRGVLGIPEPTSLVLFGLGLVGFCGSRRRNG
ncbi:PEP-CTERM sorting domain-containing protein [Adhaeretor mobilis]|uniref:PEP-CTERM motif protein n=1 Tax=Adhaeretor mobilis TaxID=1930276 RepID=A0A517MS87_9BACT|nr:PEP-CTERM sorting domain-containing protein [Adhaeretor mobilis]QDS97647.1 PEP-CTERM motif protein [Adhaeretor mobilis]